MHTATLYSKINISIKSNHRTSFHNNDSKCNFILYLLSTTINGCVWTGQLDRGPALENMFWLASPPWVMSVTHKISCFNCHCTVYMLLCDNNSNFSYLRVHIEKYTFEKHCLENSKSWSCWWGAGNQKKMHVHLNVFMWLHDVCNCE